MGRQKQLDQTAHRYGRRLSILGIWEPGLSFSYALAQGSFNSESYLQVMDWVATTAAQFQAETGQITVLVQDNGSLHRSRLVQAAWPRWQAQGLYFFFLPAYCSELNPIEGEWRQLKSHEMAGQMFDNEYDLALAVIQGVEARSIAGGYQVERFKFNSA